MNFRRKSLVPGRALRTPFGEIELCWWQRQPRRYYAADQVVIKTQPASQAVLPASTETTWIEVQLVDEEGEPIPGERYEIVLPDGAIVSGKLNFRGRARVNDISAPGQCLVRFPDLDADAWQRIS